MIVLRHVALFGTAFVTALGALGWLHGDDRPEQALLCAIVAWGGAVAVRGVWRGLPSFVTGWLDGGVAVVIALLGAGATLGEDGIPYLVLRWRELAWISVVAGLAGTGVSVLGYTHHRLAGEVAAQAERNAAWKRRALESHFAALSAQVNPHFLFNTLNTLAQVVHEDADLAEDMITDLAAMMRYSLESSTRWVTLGDEIDLIRRLLRLESARLVDRLTTEVRFDEALADVRVPGLLVQPLVENAVKYGAAASASGGRVAVSVVANGDRVRVEVQDDGPGIPASVAAALHTPGRGTAGAGGGLYNVAERARLAWPDGAAAVHVDPTEAGTTVVIEFPAHGGEA